MTDICYCGATRVSTTIENVTIECCLDCEGIAVRIDGRYCTNIREMRKALGGRRNFKATMKRVGAALRDEPPLAGDHDGKHL